MAGNTVVILKNLLTATSCSANWLIVGGGRSAGIDRGCVNDEGDAKRAKYGLFLDYAVPSNNGWSSQACGVSVTEEAWNKVSKIRHY